MSQTLTLRVPIRLYGGKGIPSLTIEVENPLRSVKRGYSGLCRQLLKFITYYQKCRSREKEVLGRLRNTAKTHWSLSASSTGTISALKWVT